MAVEHVDFASNNIASADYDLDTRELVVTFLRTGDEYAYQKVPDSIWAQFKAAPSAGKFFAQSIKGIFGT